MEKQRTGAKSGSGSEPALAPARSKSPTRGDKEAAPLISVIYLLKTVYKKEAALPQLHQLFLFKVRGRSNIKDLISALCDRKFINRWENFQTVASISKIKNNGGLHRQ